MTIAEVLQFWFCELEPIQWWQKDIALDREIERRFGALHRNAILGRASTPEELAFFKQPDSSF